MGGCQNYGGLRGLGFRVSGLGTLNIRVPYYTREVVTNVVLALSRVFV